MENSKLNCQNVELLMQDYLDGYLLNSQRELLEKHLALCPECRHELLQMKRLEERFENSIPVEVPPGFGENIASRLPRSVLDTMGARRAVRLTGMGLASAFITLLVILFVFSPYGKEAGYHEVEIIFPSSSARSISVAGDFNDWNTANHMMSKEHNGSWRLKLSLPPGLYQYNFFIDDQFWAEDPSASAVVSDGFGGRNALLYIEG